MSRAVRDDGGVSVDEGEHVGRRTVLRDEGAHDFRPLDTPKGVFDITAMNVRKCSSPAQHALGTTARKRGHARMHRAATQVLSSDCFPAELQDGVAHANHSVPPHSPG